MCVEGQGVGDRMKRGTMPRGMSNSQHRWPSDDFPWRHFWRTAGSWYAGFGSIVVILLVIGPWLGSMYAETGVEVHTVTRWLLGVSRYRWPILSLLLAPVLIALPSAIELRRLQRAGVEAPHEELPEHGRWAASMLFSTGGMLLLGYALPLWQALEESGFMRRFR